MSVWLSWREDRLAPSYAADVRGGNNVPVDQVITGITKLVLSLVVYSTSIQRLCSGGGLRRPLPSRKEECN